MCVLVHRMSWGRPNVARRRLDPFDPPQRRQPIIDAAMAQLADDRANVPSGPKTRQPRERCASPSEKPPSDDRLTILALEDDICELTAAAGLDLGVKEGIGPLTSFVLDQIERLAKQLQEKYYKRDK
jgi:hypothetical protein